jgi:hypothetical protein
MVLKESTITKLTISDIPNLDPINVFFEDYGPQRGKVTIEVCGDSWSYFWGAMGEGYSIKSFFLKADTDYLVGKLKIGIRRTIDDDSQEALVLAAKKEVIKSRRFDGYSKHWARDKWDLIDEITDEGKESNSDILYEIFGSDWYESLPQQSNPKYQYLCRIVNTIKEALRIPPEVV